MWNSIWPNTFDDEREKYEQNGGEARGAFSAIHISGRTTIEYARVGRRGVMTDTMNASVRTSRIFKTRARNTHGEQDNYQWRAWRRTTHVTTTTATTTRTAATTTTKAHGEHEETRCARFKGSRRDTPPGRAPVVPTSSRCRLYDIRNK